VSPDRGRSSRKAAYQAIVRKAQSQIEIWSSRLEVGRPLPVLPLALNAEVVLLLDLEISYTVDCLRRRLG